MDYASEEGRPIYLGQMSWQKFEVAALRYMPFVSEFFRAIHSSSGFVFRHAIAMEDAGQRTRRAGQSGQFLATGRLDLPLPRPGSP